MIQVEWVQSIQIPKDLLEPTYLPSFALRAREEGGVKVEYEERIRKEETRRKRSPFLQ